MSEGKVLETGFGDFMDCYHTAVKMIIGYIKRLHKNNFKIRDRKGFRYFFVR
jgi:hypothetical protein